MSKWKLVKRSQAIEPCSDAAGLDDEGVRRSRRAVVLSCPSVGTTGSVVRPALRREPSVQRIEGVFSLKNNPTKTEGESQAKVRREAARGGHSKAHSVQCIFLEKFLPGLPTNWADGT